MKGKNFLLAFAPNAKQQIKGKNPNPSAKIISTNKLRGNNQKVDKQQTESKTSSIKQNKKSQIVTEIQKLQKKLQSTNQLIQQTQKKLDVDLFLKQQKQKRQQYAKDLNKQFQIQKKKREQKIYKKYNKDSKQDDQNNGQQNLQQTKNVKSAFPLQLIKLLQNQKVSITKSKTILNGHHYSFKEFQNDQAKWNEIINFDKINEQEKQLLFQVEVENKENQKYSTNTIQKMAQNMLNVIYFPIKIQGQMLQPIQQYENIMNALVLMPQHISSKYYSSSIIGKINYFMCKFFFNGQTKTVITSDLIQTRQFAHYHINLHSKVADNRNFGPTIIQKCYRKVSGNYQNLELKSAIYTLYGADAQIIPISNKNYLKDNFQLILKFLMQAGQLVGFMNSDGHNSTIYENRLYKLKQIAEIVQMVNQQTNDKKNKKKKKKDQQNQQQLKQKKQISRKTVYSFQNSYKGLVLDSKGLNKFQLLQVLQKFNRLILIRDYPKGWSCKRINLQIFSLGPLSMTSNEWTKNNQYNFHVSSAMNLRIVMRKQLISGSQSIIKKQNKKQQDFQTNSLYGFMIFQCKQGQQKITCMKLDSLIVKTKSNDFINGGSFCEKLQKGSYIIIPYSNRVTKTHYEFYTIDFFVEKEDHIKFGKAVINQWKWNRKNGQNDNQKVIQSLQSKQYVQKIKIQDIQINRISPSNINPQKLIKNLQAQNINIPKDLKINDILIPGKLYKFLINPQIQITKPNKNSNKNVKEKDKPKKQAKYTHNQQIQTLQKQQALQILLGYDILQGQEIDRGIMLDQMQNNQQVFDFQHYGIGNDGLTVMIQTLMSYPSIRKLNLASNDLDDSSIVFLCYYLQKSNRVELQQLIISNNNFGKIGMQAIKGLMTKFQHLHVTY